jgi:hypothetical protein
MHVQNIYVRIFYLFEIKFALEIKLFFMKDILLIIGLIFMSNYDEFLIEKDCDDRTNLC